MLFSSGSKIGGAGFFRRSLELQLPPADVVPRAELVAYVVVCADVDEAYSLVEADTAWVGQGDAAVGVS